MSPAQTLPSTSGAAASPTASGPHITIYPGKSVYSNGAGANEEFTEGAATTSAKQRFKAINDSLDAGYLDNLIDDCIKNPGHVLTLDENHIKAITQLTNFDSESGRAILGLTFMQLAIKSICPTTTRLQFQYLPRM